MILNWQKRRQMARPMCLVKIRVGWGLMSRELVPRKIAWDLSVGTYPVLDMALSQHAAGEPYFTSA